MQEKRFIKITKPNNIFVKTFDARFRKISTAFPQIPLTKKKKHGIIKAPLPEGSFLRAPGTVMTGRRTVHAEGGTTSGRTCPVSPKRVQPKSMREVPNK